MDARTNHRRIPRLACILALVAIAGCGAAQDAPHNVLLITVDTLRADRLGAYGYSRSTSPNIDRLARESICFERAYASSSWTLPSLTSLLTGLYPSAHGCTRDHASLPEAYATLAEGLRREGYRTGAVASHVYLARRYGLDQGFEDYDEELVFRFAERQRSHLAISSPDLTTKALEWIGEHAAGDRPWMYWVHYFDPHNEYLAHPGVSDPFGTEQPSDLYDGEIAFTDRHVGRLLDGLEQLGLDENTIVVFCADHGEEFGEHGGQRHRKTLFDEVLRVPLLLRVPDEEPRRVSEAVSLVDVAPTLCELLDVPGLPHAQGVSLAPLVRGEPLERAPILAELTSPKERLTGILHGSHKLVRSLPEGKVALYDLELDPAERKDLAREDEARTGELLGWLTEGLAQNLRLQERIGEERSIELSAEDRATLRSLGYAGEDEPRPGPADASPAAGDQGPRR